MTTETDTEKMAQAFPAFPHLVKKLGTPDAAFEAWRDTTADKHWAHFDLSALRIGYELGKALHDTARAQPASVAGGWTKDAPTAPGWYWHMQGGGAEVFHVFERPGHKWLCIEGGPYGPMQKRNFIRVHGIGGLWSTHPIAAPQPPAKESE